MKIIRDVLSNIILILPYQQQQQQQQQKVYNVLGYSSTHKFQTHSESATTDL